MLTCSAAAKKAGPFNSGELSRLLGMLAGREETGAIPLSSQNRHFRSPTSSPAPEDNSRFEAFCRDELVQAGGRPVATFEHFLDALKNEESSKEILRLWLDDSSDWSCRDGDVPPAFSMQLEDWESFQHKWQWDNRGKYAGDEGFTAFSESRRRRWLHKGESDLVSDPSFEATARHIWQHEERWLELSGQEGFEAYTQAVERRLASHQFTQPFQLSKDPRQQDARTTMVEYLNYVYWWRDKHAAAMEAAKPQYQKAWDELQRFDASPLSTTSTTTEALSEELSATKALLERTRQQIRKFIKDTKTHQRCEKAVYCQELRAQWTLEQLPLIDAESSAENEVAKNSSSANSTRKRKARDDDQNPPLQQLKRRRQGVGHSGSTLDLEPGTRKESDIAMSDETATTSTAASSRIRRSLRSRAGNAEALSSQRQPKARGTRKTRQRTTQEGSLGSTTPQTSRPRRQKFKNVTT